MTTPPRDFGRARRIARDTLWSGSIGSFSLDSIELADGGRIQLALLEHPGAAAVVPFIDDQRILLLRQYRYAAHGTIWEVPAGKLDPGEDPEACAARELQEETGYRAATLEHLGKIHTTPGFTDEVIHLFRATGLSHGTQSLDPDERIETTEVALTDALAMVDRGEITDGKTICALFHVWRKRA